LERNQKYQFPLDGKTGSDGKFRQEARRPDCSGSECSRGLFSVGRGRATLGAPPPATPKSPGQASYSGKPESAPKNQPILPFSKLKGFFALN